MAASKVTFSSIENDIIHEVDKKRTLRALKYVLVERMNIAIYRDLVKASEGKKASYDMAYNAYHAFLDTSPNHPVYTDHPWLAPYVMFMKRPSVVRQSRAGNNYLLSFKQRSSQKLTYKDSFGDDQTVKVPFYLQGFMGKHKSKYSDHYITISKEDAHRRAGAHIVGKLEENREEFCQLIEANYTPPESSTKKRVNDAYALYAKMEWNRGVSEKKGSGQKSAPKQRYLPGMEPPPLKKFHI